MRPDLTVHRKGIADEELAKKEEERGRKRKADEFVDLNGSRKRSRSISSYSSTSVSTISTNLSRSLSPKNVGHDHTGQSQLLSNLEVDRNRGRSSSTMSYTSDSSPDRRRGGHSRSQGRRASFQEQPASPNANGRERHLRERSTNRPMSPNRRIYSRSRSMSYTSESSFDRRRRKDSHGEDRSKRRRHSSRSPDGRGRERDFYSKRGSRRTKSPSESRDRSQVIRNRKSMTPGLPAQHDRSRLQSHRHSIDRSQSYLKDNDRYGSSARDQDENTKGIRKISPPRRRQRSLSPYSKRIALTQAMNMG